MKVKHFVLLKFNENCNEQEIAECFAALTALTKLLPGIENFSYGTYSSPEGLNRGFTHAFEMIFSNSEARDNYLTAPAHVKVANKLLALVAKISDKPEIIAFDYAIN